MANQRVLSAHIRKHLLLALHDYENDVPCEDKKISCAEVVEALQHTIDFVKSNVPLDISMSNN